MSKRLPAEWEPQQLVLLSFPRRDGDYGAFVEPAARQHLELCLAISAATPVYLLVADRDLFDQSLQDTREAHEHFLGESDEEVVPPSLARAAHTAQRVIKGIAHPIYVRFQETNDVWARDFGPLTLIDGQRPYYLDFTFNGWGKKYPADHDNDATNRLLKAGFFGDHRPLKLHLVLEGGSIESDGAGTLMSTRKCLLEPNRNPLFKESDIFGLIKGMLYAEQLLLLNHGHLENDDTDAHIDTLARFAPDNTIVYQSCDDPEDDHYADFQRMARELASFKNTAGKPYRLLPLPWPGAIISKEDGRRLPASYANFLVTNGLVLCPRIHEKSDPEAIAVLQDAFPGHEVQLVDADYLLEQHGSIHCLTMQLPLIPGDRAARAV